MKIKIEPIYTDWHEYLNAIDMLQRAEMDSDNEGARWLLNLMQKHDKRTIKRLKFILEN